MRSVGMKQRSGFTLLEIIVVLIILGLIATMAVSSYFSWIQKASAAEAFASIKSIKFQYLTCLRAHVGDEAACFNRVVSCVGGNLCQEGLTQASPNFTYLVRDFYCTPSGCDAANHQGISVTAYKNPGVTDVIWISVSPNDSQSMCWGEGIFQGVC